MRCIAPLQTDVCIACRGALHCLLQTFASIIDDMNKTCTRVSTLLHRERARKSRALKPGRNNNTGISREVFPYALFCPRFALQHGRNLSCTPGLFEPASATL